MATTPNEQQERDQSFRRAMSLLYVAKRHEMDEDRDARNKLAPYFSGRGIDAVPESAMFLPSALVHTMAKRHPELKWEENDLTRFPAFVQPISSGGKIQGAQVTFLSRDGNGNLRRKGKSLRRTVGSIKGGTVQVTRHPPEPNRPLIVGEGVETVLSAAQLTGYAALAALSANNLQNLTLPPCSELIVLADNDDAGASAAEQLAARCTALGGSVRIVAPPRRYGDWNAALCRSSNPERLRRLIANAPTSESVYQVEPVSAENFMTLKFPKRPYLLRPWLRQTNLAMIHAQRGNGKTLLALFVAHAIASGKPLLDWSAESIRRVLYVDGEMPGELLQERINMLGALPADLLMLSQDQLALSNQLMPDLATKDGQDYLDAIIERSNVSVVILDSISTLVRSGIENEGESWAPIQQWILKHRWRGRTIILLHHEGRSGNPRGTSKREDVLDVIAKLRERKDIAGGSGSAFELSFTKNREFYGADAAPKILRFRTDENGVGQWSHEPVKNNHQQVAEMLGEGVKQSQIAKRLEITPARVSQIVRELNEATATNDASAQTIEVSPLFRRRNPRPV